jgi:hypothetical protein
VIAVKGEKPGDLPVSGTDLSVHSQAYLNKAARQLNERGHARPCNLKPQQRDLTPVLRRSVEPGAQSGHPPQWRRGLLRKGADAVVVRFVATIL